MCYANLRRRRNLPPNLEKVDPANSRPTKAVSGIHKGRRVEAVFAGTRPQKRKADGEEFMIRSVDELPQGLTVVVSFPPTAAMKKARNIMERMQLILSVAHYFEGVSWVILNKETH